MSVMEPWREGEAAGTRRPPRAVTAPRLPRGCTRPFLHKGPQQTLQAGGCCPGAGGPAAQEHRGPPLPAVMDPLTGRQVLGSKSGQVMLEMDEMNWPCIFMQLKKVYSCSGGLSSCPRAVGQRRVCGRPGRSPTQKGNWRHLAAPRTPCRVQPTGPGPPGRWHPGGAQGLPACSPQTGPRPNPHIPQR